MHLGEDFLQTRHFSLIRADKAVTANIVIMKRNGELCFCQLILSHLIAQMQHTLSGNAILRPWHSLSRTNRAWRHTNWLNFNL